MRSVALVIKKNSVNCYLYNTVTNRVVYPNAKDNNTASHILNLIPDKCKNTVSHDPSVRYEVHHHVGGSTFMFSNVVLDGRVVRSCINGLASAKKARKYAEELTKYGIRLF